MSYSVFPLHEQNHLKAKMFLDEAGGVNVARYEKVKYPALTGFLKKQKGFMWAPEEIDLTVDSKEYKELNKHEQHIFVSNLLRQSLLDSVQGRAPMLAFGAITTLPELEAWWIWQGAIEQIHNESYTHIVRNGVPDPSKIFDTLLEIEPIVDCAKSISSYYDKLIHLNNLKAVHETYDLSYDAYEHKKALWLALHALNALEGIRFYVSFACSWAFAETERMKGNAKIIKLICRDENLHLGFVQQTIKMLPKDDPDYISIREECLEETRQIFIEAAEQEVSWAKYLFKDGSMLGLNEHLLTQYVHWITSKRMSTLKYESPYKVASNPLPWTEKWIAGGDVQVAPQEQELTMYTSQDIKRDLSMDSMRGLSL